MAFALVTHDHAFNTGGVDAVTSGVDTTGTTLLVVGIACDGGFADPTLTDSKSNTWSHLTAVLNPNNAVRCRLHYCANPTVGAAHTFTAAGNAAYQAVYMAAFSGTVTSPFDAESTSGGAGSDSPGTTQAPGSITPTLAASVLVAMSRNDGAVYSSNNGGFSVADSSDAALIYLIQVGVAPANPTITFADNGDRVVVMACFKPPAAPDTNIWTAFRL